MSVITITAYLCVAKIVSSDQCYSWYVIQIVGRISTVEALSLSLERVKWLRSKCNAKANQKRLSP